MISVNPIFNFELNENSNLTAHFEYNPAVPGEPDGVKKRKIYLSSNPAGKCSFNYSSGVEFAENENVFIRAYCSEGYVLESWVINGVTINNTSNSYTVNVGSSNVNIVVNLRFDPLTPQDPEQSAYYLIKGNKIGRAHV